jgi:hypothetical protein
VADRSETPVPQVFTDGQRVEMWYSPLSSRWPATWRPAVVVQARPSTNGIKAGFASIGVALADEDGRPTGGVSSVIVDADTGMPVRRSVRAATEPGRG